MAEEKRECKHCGKLYTPRSDVHCKKGYCSNGCMLKGEKK